ncbi:type II secretion system protein GspH [Chimaeribacter californicus]|uniref:Type II secretion system protein H n=1 Tax=Chimaeribacter californicus TaxID=2060067 RepID=A0A2N5DVD8_9GAMM|nr:type II secretion system minor pseudopilin GspH [Chimaeribacter californicus]PLR30994.1 type II secretion system protein GspH [Chimaeribacter californicus]
MKLERQAGFTLLEIMLVLMIMAGGAVVVMSSTGSVEERRQSSEAGRLVALMEYAADHATMTGTPVGLQVTDSDYLFMTPQQRNTTPVIWRWVPFSKGALPGHAQSFSPAWQIELFINGDAVETRGTPQIIFYPDGAITAFQLRITDRATTRPLLTLTCNGLWPVTVLNEAQMP